MLGNILFFYEEKYEVYAHELVHPCDDHASIVRCMRRQSEATLRKMQISPSRLPRRRDAGDWFCYNQRLSADCCQYSALGVTLPPTSYCCSQWQRWSPSDVERV